MSQTPYDDVFRTLLNDCSSLILFILNEIFGEHYTGDETIEFSPNEHFLNQQDGDEDKRITDSCFRVLANGVWKTYHAECQATPDSSMLIRIFEYDTQIALDSAEIENNVLIVRFPHSAVLFLRDTANTPDKMTIRMTAGGKELSYDIPVMKVQRYDVDEIFEKRLYFLIPFYIFTHEKRFAEYETDEGKLQSLCDEFESIKRRLDAVQREGAINEFIKRAIIDMTKKVIENIAARHKKVREGVKTVMGGRILDYEAKDILNKGRAEGRNEGRAEGHHQGLIEGEKNERENRILRAISLKKLSFEDIAEMFEVPLAKVTALGHAHALI